MDSCKRPASWRARVVAGLIAALGVIASSTAVARARGDCPEGFVPRAGLNKNFLSDGKNRAFIVVPPTKPQRTAPVWVPMVGTVEAANWNLYAPRSGNNAKLAEAGFMVIEPIRDCADQDPALAAGRCNGVGANGWTWNPWNDGRAPGPNGDVYKTDPGADVRFLNAMVRCVGTKWKLDAKRFYLGGISAGGTMTNRALLFDSKFWAGGMPISGEWYVTKDDGSSVAFQEARKMVAAEPTKIWQGRVGPMPLAKRLDPMIVLTVWGGDKDLWDCGPPLGLCSDYRPTTQASSNYFSSISGIVHIACSATHGHMWPQVNTDAFNLWALKTLASFPKGSRTTSFRLSAPPEGYKCQLGRFTDHYK